MEMSEELLSSIGAQLEQTNRLVHSLYDSGDLSVDQYDAIVHGLSGAALLRKEVAQHQTRLDDVMRAGDLEHARMASLIEACEATAAFIESYTPDSDLALYRPTFYGLLRVYGKNARAAVQAVRPQADALLSRLHHAEVGLAAEQELRARSEMIVLAARRLVAGPDSTAYTTLAAAIDAYDEATKARDE